MFIEYDWSYEKGWWQSWARHLLEDMQLPILFLGVGGTDQRMVEWHRPVRPQPLPLLPAAAARSALLLLAGAVHRWRHAWRSKGLLASQEPPSLWALCMRLTML